MSGIFALIQDRVLESVGGATVTSDNEFDDGFRNLKRMQEICSLLELRISNHIASLASFLEKTSFLSSEFKTYFERSPDYLLASELDVVLSDTGSTKLVEYRNTMEQEVMVLIRAWKTELDALKKEVDARNDARLKYDHYLRKIKSLRSEYEKQRQKGKSESQKDAEKRERNERKFQESQSDFQNFNEASCKHLLDEWNNRTKILKPIFTKFSTIHASFFNDFGNCLSSASKIIREGDPTANFSPMYPDKPVHIQPPVAPIPKQTHLEAFPLETKPIEIGKKTTVFDIFPVETMNVEGISPSAPEPTPPVVDLSRPEHTHRRNSNAPISNQQADEHNHRKSPILSMPIQPPPPPADHKHRRNSQSSAYKKVESDIFDECFIESKEARPHLPIAPPPKARHNLLANPFEDPAFNNPQPQSNPDTWL